MLIKCIAGLLKPDSGEIDVLGYDVPSLSLKELNKLRLQIGFSFQGSALYDSMSVRENLEFPLKRNLGIYDRSKLNKLVKTSLEDVGLESAINMNPAELWGGMKKRVEQCTNIDSQPEDHVIRRTHSRTGSRNSNRNQ